MFDRLFRFLPGGLAVSGGTVAPTLFSRGVVAIVVAVAVAGSTVALSPTEVYAQGCGHCHDLGEDQRHWAHKRWTPMSGHGKGHGWHFYSARGVCLVTHGICVFVASDDSEVTVNPLELVDEIATAVRDQDVQRLAEFASHSSVRIAPKRLALQVLGCNGTIVGHIPIGSKLFTAVTGLAYADEP